LLGTTTTSYKLFATPLRKYQLLVAQPACAGFGVLLFVRDIPASAKQVLSRVCLPLSNNRKASCTWAVPVGGAFHLICLLQAKLC